MQKYNLIYKEKKRKTQLVCTKDLAYDTKSRFFLSVYTEYTCSPKPKYQLSIPGYFKRL